MKKSFLFIVTMAILSSCSKGPSRSGLTSSPLTTIYPGIDTCTLKAYATRITISATGIMTITTTAPTFSSNVYKLNILDTANRVYANGYGRACAIVTTVGDTSVVPNADLDYVIGAGGVRSYKLYINPTPGRGADVPYGDFVDTL